MFISSITLLTFLFYVVITFSQATGDQFSFQTDRNGSTHPVLDDEFAAWLEETGNARGMKGVAIAVTRRNQDNAWTTETKGYGVADRWGTLVDDETLFAIGSNSKLFTAIGIGLLIANESIPIDWDTKIKDILPNTLWNLQDPIAQDHADLVDILSHRTGLPRHDVRYSLTDTPESAIAKLRYLRPSAEFRQTGQYNHRMPFQNYITHNIISPLGMNSTTYSIAEAEQYGKVADGFLDTCASGGVEPGAPERCYKPIPFWTKKGGEDLIAGAGSIISNAKDMATWLQALILSGRSPKTNASVIHQSILEKVTTGVIVMSRWGPEPEIGPFVYGMGQARYTYQGHEFIEHNGGTIGHYSIVTRSAYDDLGVAILINSLADREFLEMIKWRLLEKSLGLKHIDWNKRYPIRAIREDNAHTPNITRIFPRSSKGIPSTLPQHNLAGVYFNPAYGRLTLCSYPPSRPVGPTLKECDGILSEAIQSLFNTSAPALLAAFPKVWLTHLLLLHNSADKFDATTILTFPAPFPDAPKNEEDSRPFVFTEVFGSAEFTFSKRPGEETVHVEGVGWRGIWGALGGVKELTGEVRESAEVWFDRVD